MIGKSSITHQFKIERYFKIIRYYKYKIYITNSDTLTSLKNSNSFQIDFIKEPQDFIT